ncbi:hypothetical protein LAZ67_X003111 [Cordylochernes scorpioides]|uniref:CCHC-type domain-containing protein n=1 Tax=Cordylochernes scorpioides TaxID=51811 RepID=A0ABY6LYS4_9ARAC|nr:hypothetical protein LAZ67_X003111 [Cordylochernes scorpioides]
MKDGGWELFILLNEGVKLERLPTRLNINYKGEILPAFLVYGVKCSRCQRQGHRRANCPLTPKRPTDAPEQAPCERRSQARPCAHYTHRGSTCCSHSGTIARKCSRPLPLFPSLSSPTATKSVEKSSPNQPQDPLQDQRDSINVTPSGKSTKSKGTPQAGAGVYLRRDREAETRNDEWEQVIEGLQFIPGLKNLLFSMTDT